MWINFTHTLSRSRGQILGWGIGLGLYAGYMVGFFDNIIGMRAQFEELKSAYPPEIQALVGGADLFSPSGFVHTYLFSYTTIILGILAVLAGSGLLVSDEEDGTLDLLLGHPVSRTRLFLGRASALAVTLVAVLGIIWLASVIGSLRSSIGLGAGEMALPFVSLLAVLLLFASLALLFSMLLPSRRMAASAAGVVLVASFLLDVAAEMDPGLETISQFSPLHYYQGGMAIEGMEWGWVLGLVALAVLFGAAALWLFQRREIRVAGEGGFGFPGLPFRRGKEVTLPVEAG